MHQEGRIIAGRYRLDALLGEGGMGAVWKATHLELEREVAIKLVLQGRASEHFIKRFMREAKLAASVRHRNVIDVIDFGKDEEGLPYLVMELLEGESLEARLARKPAPTHEELLFFMDGALAGLGAIHDSGIVHRDLKPANLFLSEDAEGIVPKVLDFGISRAVDPEQQGSVLTHTMQTLGTPHYMSPEQIRSARDVDGRSDLYAIGVILYEALAGCRPFDGPSAPAIIASIVSDEPAALHTLRPDLPRALGRIVARAMARDPKRRFADAAELREALLRVGSEEAATVASTPKKKADKSEALPETRVEGRDKPQRARRRFLFGLSGGLMSLLGMGAAFFLFFSGSQDNGLTGEAGTGDTSERGGQGVGGVTGTMDPGSGNGGGSQIQGLTPPGGGLDGLLNGVGRAGGGASPTLTELALRWRALPELERAEEVRFVRLSAERWTVVARGEGAREILTRLGVRAVQDPEAAWESGLRPALVRTRDRLNLRASPGREGEIRTSLPPGTLVVALYGRIGDGEEAPVSEFGGRGHWSYVVAGAGSVGFSASAFLEPERRCVPSEQALLAAFGPSFGSTGGGEGEASWEVVIARAELRLAGLDRPSLLALSRGEQRSHLRVAAIGPACQLTPFASHALPGYVEEAFFSATSAPEEAGSEPLLIVSWRGAGESRAPEVQRSWYAYLVRREQPGERPAWEALLRSSVELPRGRRALVDGPVTEGPNGAQGFWPLEIRRPGEEPSWLRLTGQTLEAVASPAPAELPAL